MSSSRTPNTPLAEDKQLLATLRNKLIKAFPDQLGWLKGDVQGTVERFAANFLQEHLNDMDHLQSFIPRQGETIYTPINRYVEHGMTQSLSPEEALEAQATIKQLVLQTLAENNISPQDVSFKSNATAVEYTNLLKQKPRGIAA